MLATYSIPLNVHQGFTSMNLTGKITQYKASKMSLLFSPQWRNNVLEDSTDHGLVCVFWHVWVITSGVRFPTGTTASTTHICYAVLKICSVSNLSLPKEFKINWNMQSIPPCVWEKCTEDTFHQWTSTVSTCQLSKVFFCVWWKCFSHFSQR